MRPRHVQYAGAPASGVSEIQTIVLTGTPTGGTFTISWDGQTTGAIARNATAAAVQTALEALTNIGAGNVVVTGGPLPGTLVQIAFDGELAGLAVAEITATTTNLTAPDPTVVTIVESVKGVVATTNEQQTIVLPNGPTGGTFTLTFGGQTTSALAYNISNANLKTALEVLSTIDVDEAVPSGGPLPALTTITFGGTLGLQDVGPITASGASLTRVLGATIATPTGGTTGTHRGTFAGTYLEDITNGNLYVNTGTPALPVWSALRVTT